MKADKLRGFDQTELERQLTEMNDQLLRLQFQMRMGQLEGLKKARTMRKDRARIYTILRQRAEGKK